MLYIIRLREGGDRGYDYVAEVIQLDYLMYLPDRKI